MLILEQVRCPGTLPNGAKCNRRLGDINGQATIRCSKCKALVHIDTDTRKIYIEKESKK